MVMMNDEDLFLLVVNGVEGSCNQLRVKTVHFAGRPDHHHEAGDDGDLDDDVGGDLAIVGLSSLDKEQHESIMPFLGKKEGMWEGESVKPLTEESTMPSFDTKDEEFIIMLLAMGELELGELVELLDDDDVKEIPRPYPIRLQQMIV